MSKQQQDATEETESNEGGGAKDNLVRMTRNKLKDRDPATDPTARETLDAITTAHAAYKTALADRARVSTECKQRLESENAAFKEAIEAPLKPNPSRAMVVSKLESVETRWQELNEVKQRNIEAKKQSKEDVQTTLERLDQAIGQASQLTLAGVA